MTRGAAAAAVTVAVAEAVAEAWSGAQGLRELEMFITHTHFF